MKALELLVGAAFCRLGRQDVAPTYADDTLQRLMNDRSKEPFKEIWQIHSK